MARTHFMLHRWLLGNVVQKVIMKDLRPSNTESLEVPEVMKMIFPAGIIEGTASPKSTAHTKREWFKQSDENGSVAKATAKKWHSFSSVRMRET